MNNVFKKEDIQTYEAKDLEDKTLKIKILEGEGILLMVGEDIETGEKYFLKEERKLNLKY